MKTIGVVCLKGGAGKTTLALNLALRSWLNGSRTLLVDLDPQASCVAALKSRSRNGPDCMPANSGKLFQIKQAAARDGVEVLVIDTPAGSTAELTETVRHADFCITVARPTFLDLTAAAQTIEAVRRLQRRALVVLNQAPPRRDAMEATAVRNAVGALQQAGLDVADTIIHARAAFQHSVARGLGVEEWGYDPAATQEIAALWEELQDRCAAGTDIRRSS